VIAALLLAVALLPTDGGPTLRASELQVELGRRVELVVDGSVHEGDELVSPALPEGLQADQPRLASENGAPVLRWPLRGVREGRFTLSGLQLRSGETLQPLPEVHVEVTLEVRGGGLPEVAAPLPPVRVPYAPVARSPIAAALLAALLLLGLFVVRAGRVVAVPPPPPRPPELIAAEALARLRGRLPRSHDEVPAFVVEVSGVLRAYIEGRFGLHAPESTTEEFLPAATAHPALAGHRDTLSRFLTGCDLVKFARHRPEPASMAELLRTAEGFVEATRA
jgi:hypothetical protein